MKSIPMLSLALPLACCWPVSAPAADPSQYDGLFFETNGVTHAHSGCFSLTRTARGLTAKFIIGGRGFSSGRAGYRVPVDGDGHAEFWFYRGDPLDGDFRHVMTAEIWFDRTDQVYGTVSDAHLEAQLVGGYADWYWVPATWTAQLAGARVVFNARTNPAPQAGTYTLIFPGGDGTNEPAGAGFATVKVYGSGQVRMSGFLADGTPITQRTAISKEGNWPFFARLYGGRGSVLGWLSFSNQPDSDIAGTLVWTKPALASARLYPAGFENEVEVVGSRYTRPPGGAMWNFTNGVLVVGGDDLNSAFTNSFMFDQKGRIANTSGTKFNLKAVSAKGLFLGSATDPETGKTFKFKGALLQNQNEGHGYFLGGNLSGSVSVQSD